MFLQKDSLSKIMSQGCEFMKYFKDTAGVKYISDKKSSAVNVL